MSSLGGSGQAPPQWLSTHPSHEARIRDLETYAQRVLPPLYEAAQPAETAAPRGGAS
jgi:predicted Zn-dependent protease